MTMDQEWCIAEFPIMRDWGEFYERRPNFCEFQSVFLCSWWVGGYLILFT